MNCEKVAQYINDWLIKKVEDAKLDGFVVGVSGGVDSGLVSTLCARTGKKTICLNMPIRQGDDYFRADEHLKWLRGKFSNVEGYEVQLDGTFSGLIEDIEESDCPAPAKDDLAMANSRSRIRMLTLYAYASHFKCLVVGTGNLVEDFGVGFFTKYGDGGVDLSPIGSLLKSKVRELAAYIDVSPSIVKAAPIDGLWEDNRTDESALGATYDELDWAVEWCNEYYFVNAQGIIKNSGKPITKRQEEVLNIYLTRHEASKHKMAMPPVCQVPAEYLK